MNLLHRPACLLPGFDPQDFGFDAVQVAWTPFGQDKLADRVEAYRGVGIWLAIQLEPWWFALEDRFDYLYGWLAGAESMLDERLLGVRLNHEHRPYEYSMIGFAKALTVPQQHVLAGKGREWNAMLDEIRNGLSPVHALEDPGRDVDLCDLYRALVRWQVGRANGQILKLAEACRQARMDLLLYPGNAANVPVSPRILPQEESTLDPDKLSHPSVIRELGSWDVFDAGWCVAHAKAVKGRWIFTMQQDLSVTLGPDEAEKGIDLRRRLLNADYKLPEGVGFWTSRVVQDDDQIAYLRGIARGLGIRSGLVDMI